MHYYIEELAFDVKIREYLRESKTSLEMPHQDLFSTQSFENVMKKFHLSLIEPHTGNHSSNQLAELRPQSGVTLAHNGSYLV